MSEDLPARLRSPGQVSPQPSVRVIGPVVPGSIVLVANEGVPPMDEPPGFDDWFEWLRGAVRAAAGHDDFALLMVPHTGAVELAEGADAERAAIVAWLRGDEAEVTYRRAAGLADLIEAGAHAREVRR